MKDLTKVTVNALKDLLDDIELLYRGAICDLQFLEMTRNECVLDDSFTHLTEQYMTVFGEVQKYRIQYHKILNEFERRGFAISDEGEVSTRPNRERLVRIADVHFTEKKGNK